jgi:hypothetical protein
MQLEADNFSWPEIFKKCIVEEELRQMGMQLQLKVDKLMKLEKELSHRCKDEKNAKKENANTSTRQCCRC